ncbi:PspC domain-containing protein [Lysobacter sp. HA35]
MDSEKPLQLRLVKSSARWLAGVCGGIADFVGWTPRSVRFLWLTVTVLTAVIPAVVAYTLLAVAMPSSRQPGQRFRLEQFRVQ